jgi:hypothetical protein
MKLLSVHPIMLLIAMTHIFVVSSALFAGADLSSPNPEMTILHIIGGLSEVIISIQIVLCLLLKVPLKTMYSIEQIESK